MPSRKALEIGVSDSNSPCACGLQEKFVHSVQSVRHWSRAVLFQRNDEVADCIFLCEDE